jgi:hypothetical protein
METDPQLTAGGSEENTGEGSLLTPDLVRQVAEKVYRMMIEELRIEQERRRLELMGWSGIQGGGGYGNVD